MKRKQTWLYTCDHCKKAGRSAGSMAKHERSCTGNPGRICLAHHALGSSPQASMASMLALLAGADPASELAALREIAGNCPICILAAIRQSQKQFYEVDEDECATFRYPFEFKTELKAAWEKANRIAMENERYDVY